MEAAETDRAREDQPWIVGADADEKARREGIVYRSLASRAVFDMIPQSSGRMSPRHGTERIAASLQLKRLGIVCDAVSIRNFAPTLTLDM